ncbi:hypothetical protein EZS27_015943 [termite gut metagenome]|uniref:Uncharacterized protein n=1 Tax=termite gut metagenome TaxID=433724 RepID=A0A5J4RRX0_9ZZZZ
MVLSLLGLSVNRNIFMKQMCANLGAIILYIGKLFIGHAN